MAPRPPSASRRRDEDTLPGPPGVGHAALGLPSPIRACLFDLDGVLTRTAELHTAAWKQMFDEYLRKRSLATGKPFVPFDAASDYDALRRRQASRGRRTLVPRRSRHPPAGWRGDRSARRRDRQRPREPQGRDLRSSPAARRRRDLRRVGALCPRGATGRPPHGGRVVEQALPRRAGLGRHRRSVRRADRRSRRQRGSTWQASRRPTPISRRPALSGSPRPRRSSSRMRSPASRQDGRGTSASSSASTASGKRTSFAAMAPTRVVTDLAALLEPA